MKQRIKKSLLSHAGEYQRRTERTKNVQVCRFCKVDRPRYWKN